MKIHIKAALMSAFVLPGLGQLYKGSKVKGGALLALVNLFLLVALVMVVQSMGEFLLTARLSGMAAVDQVIQGLQAKHGAAVKLALAAFAAIWCFGVVDALTSKAATADDEGQSANNN